MLPILNWKELEILAQMIQPLVQDAVIERVFIPSRPSFPAGYVKNEWVLLLRTRKTDLALICSVRSQAPSISLAPGKHFSNASQATQSPFGLALGKLAKGSRIRSFKMVPGDRFVWMDLDGGQALVLKLIPAAPEAFLLDCTRGSAQEGWPILSRSRANADNLEENFEMPDSMRITKELPVHSEWISSPAVYFDLLEQGLNDEALRARWDVAQRELKQQTQLIMQHRRSLSEELNKAEQESQWKHYGDLLKSVLHDPPPLAKDKTRTVWDYTSESEIKIPCDHTLSAAEHVKKFYHLAKRKTRRLEEARDRLAEIGRKSELLAPFSKAESSWEILKKLESALGISYAAPVVGSRQKKSTPWPGRKFVSQEGLEIWVGKTEKENLELTFKKARGNDLWLHVKGRPSAHAVIPIPNGKSASLDTLLDAAHLVLQYSGYTNEAKVEVDYTFRKYVKRIKDSTQASYAQNKTLIVQFDSQRIQGIFARADSLT